LYSTGKLFNANSGTPTKDPKGLPAESMILHKSDGKRISETLDIPELFIELDRAVWQVEKSLQSQKELKEEKSDLDSVNAESKKN
jgi:hypothetical protein